jgi:hypothetical protein
MAKNSLRAMNSIIQFFFRLLLLVWELPQNLVGLLAFAIIKSNEQIIYLEKEKYRYFIETPKTGVSLGSFIFWTKAGNRFPQLVNDCRMHEYGHSRQSKILGPLYLIIVGIPSLSRVFYRKWYRKKHGHPWENYFNAFPENWADKLGGVTFRKS